MILEMYENQYKNILTSALQKELKDRHNIWQIIDLNVPFAERKAKCCE